MPETRELVSDPRCKEKASASRLPCGQASHGPYRINPRGLVDDLIETAKAHFRTKMEHPFRVIKQQFGFKKTRLRVMIKNGCKVKVLAALSNIFIARHELLCRT